MNRTAITNSLLLAGTLTCTAFTGAGVAHADTTTPATTTVADVAAKAVAADTKTPVKDAKPAADTTKSAKDAATLPAPKPAKHQGATTPSREQADGCDHGATGKTCRPDPQSTHGKDCLTHGKRGGINEDHCATVPTKPTKPTEPTKPTKPTEPTKPTKPTEPGAPDVPVKPGSGTLVVPVFPPVTTPVCGTNNDEVILPEGPGVVWSKGAWSNGSIVITATAMPGFSFGDTTTKSFTLVDAGTECGTTPTKPGDTTTPTKPGKHHHDRDCDHSKPTKPGKGHHHHDGDCDHSKPTKPGTTPTTPGEHHDGDCDHSKPTKPGTTPETPGKTPTPVVEVPLNPAGTPTTPVVTTPSTPVVVETPSTPVVETPSTVVVQTPATQVVQTPSTPVSEVAQVPAGVQTPEVVTVTQAPSAQPSPEVVTVSAQGTPQSSGAAPFFKSGIDDEDSSPVLPASLAGGSILLGLVALVTRRRRANA